MLIINLNFEAMIEVQRHKIQILINNVCTFYLDYQLNIVLIILLWKDKILQLQIQVAANNLAVNWGGGLIPPHVSILYQDNCPSTDLRSSTIGINSCMFIWFLHIKFTSWYMNSIRTMSPADDKVFGITRGPMNLQLIHIQI